MTSGSIQLCGLVLAAGGGRRFGGPKALATDAAGVPWIQRAVRMLQAGGCRDIVVTLGAAANDALRLLPVGVTTVIVDDWRDGVAASLNSGLLTAECRRADAVIITPVDTPDASPLAVRRLALAAGPAPQDALIQATYRGAPGHPVLLGRDHIAAVARSVRGDRGARDYLVAHSALAVECGDLWSGEDIDVRPRSTLSR